MTRMNTDKGQKNAISPPRREGRREDKRKKSCSNCTNLDYCTAKGQRRKGSSAGFPTCCIADFQSAGCRKRLARTKFGRIAGWKHCDTAGLETCATRSVLTFYRPRPRKKVRAGLAAGLTPTLV